MCSRVLKGSSSYSKPLSYCSWDSTMGLFLDYILHVNWKLNGFRPPLHQKKRIVYMYVWNIRSFLVFWGANVWFLEIFSSSRDSICVRDLFEIYCWNHLTPILHLKVATFNISSLIFFSYEVFICSEKWKEKVVTDVECWERFPLFPFSSEALIRNRWRECEEA